MCLINALFAGVITAATRIIVTFSFDTKRRVKVLRCLSFLTLSVRGQLLLFLAMANKEKFLDEIEEWKSRRSIGKRMLGVEGCGGGSWKAEKS